MLSHALTIVVNELEKHLNDTYGAGAVTPQVRLGNIAEGIGNGGASAGAVPRDILDLSMVNIREEKTLKNVQNIVRNDSTLRVIYQNPPVFLNFHILVVATHSIYVNALLMLSRAIKFFQFTNVFNQDSVAPASLTANAPSNPLDQLDTFKLIFDLYSPTMEEVNHLWGTLGGKQYPFVLYTLRLLEIQYKASQSEAGLITNVVNDFYHKTPSTG
jgi:Pvc16 N-terminal domain